jgi:hypothetical protein
MSAIRFEVWWSDTSREILTCDLDQRVVDVIELLRRQVGTALPEDDSLGHEIEYALYRDDRGQRCALQRRLPLERASIPQDAQLYLADRKAPWWELTPITISPPPDNGKTVLTAFIQCKLQFAPGCVVDVPPSGIQLDRNYLFAILPRTVILWENSKIMLGRGSPLLRVSREPHCTIKQRDAQWILQAHKPTYINGKRLQKDADVTLSQSTTITLGSDGWAVEVQLNTR